MPPTDRPAKRTYTRRTPTGKRIVLNEFQADVVLGAIKAEITRVEGDRNTPRSLRVLALDQLRQVVSMLEPDDVKAEVPS